MSLTHPRRAWYGSSGGTWDPLAAAAATSGWAVLPYPIPGTLTTVPPPAGSNDLSLHCGILVRSDKVTSVMQLFSLCISAYRAEFPPLSPASLWAEQNLLRKQRMLRRSLSSVWLGMRHEQDEQIHVVPGFDLPLICFVWSKYCSQNERQLRQWLPAHARDGAGPQRFLEGTPAPREADGPFWSLSGKNPWPRKRLLMFSLWIALLWGDWGQEVSRGHRLLSLELRQGEELIEELCQRAPLSQGLQSEEATLHIKDICVMASSSWKMKGVLKKVVQWV